MVTCRLLSVIIFLFYINLSSCLFDFPPEYQRDNDGDQGVPSQDPPYYRNENHGCPGCVFDLNPNVFGVSDLVFTALKHIETEHNQKYSLVEVKRLQRQITSGVKYILLIDVAPTDCPKNVDQYKAKLCKAKEEDAVTCEIELFEKPWISDNKYITLNNCTETQEFVIPQIYHYLRRDDSANEIEGSLKNKRNFNKEMTPDRLKSLESQILADSMNTEGTHVVATEDNPNLATLGNTEDANHRGGFYTEAFPINWGYSHEDLSVIPLQSSLDDFKLERNTDGPLQERESVREIRSIGRLEKISPDEKPLVRDLSDYVAAVLDGIDEDNHKRVILQILGAKKSHGKGTNYHLILRLGISHCLEDHIPGVTEKCRQKLFNNLTKICKVQVHLDEDMSNPEIIKSQCQNIKKDENDKNRTNYSRYKRSRLLGAPSTKPNDDPTALEYLKHSLQYFDDAENKYKLKEVTSVTSQVVSGSLWKISAKFSLTECPKDSDKDPQECNELEGGDEKECSLEFWDQPWLENGLQTKIDCGDGEKTHVSNTISRKKRDIRGGVKTLPNDDPRALKYIEHSLQFFDTGDTKPKLKEIKSVTTQTVSGSLVKITATFVSTNCPKDSDTDLEDCEEQIGGEEKECKLEFWDQPWLENGLRTKIDCGDGEKTHVTNTISRKRRNVPLVAAGGVTTLSNDDPRALKYIEHSLQFFDTGDTKPKLKEIKSVTTQVVSGSLVKITATFVSTNCPKDSDTDLEDCEEQIGGEEKECKLEFWDQPWLENGLRTKIDCGDGEKTHVTNTISRKRRNVPLVAAGGVTTLSNDDPRALKYIEHSLQFFDTGDTKPKLKEIKSVTTQVVSGSLVKITATFVSTNCPKDSDTDLEDCEEQIAGEEKECKLKFWDRPWLANGLETKIDCGDGEKTHVTNTISRKRRDAHGVPGGVTTLSNDDHRALKYIEHSLQFFDMGDTKPKLKEIKSVTTQVVSGSLVTITATFVPTNCPKDSDTDLEDCEEQIAGEEKECKLKFWDRPWLANGLETKIDCGDGEKTHVTNTISRKRRSVPSSSGIPGGVTTLANDDPRALKYIEHSLQFFDTGDTKPKLKEIKSVTTQVVSGSLVKITAIFVSTNCPKDSDTDLEDCEEQIGGEEKECKLEFWDQPWLENGLQTKIDCGDGEKTHVTNTISRKRRNVPMPGGAIALPNDNPTALRYVHDSLQYFDTSDTKYKLKEITSVTSQVVAGSLMKVTAVFVPTNCPRDSDKEPQNCEELEGGEEKICKFKFWDRPWLENGLQITRDCGDEVKTFTAESPFRSKESRKKRSVEDNVIDVEFGYQNLFNEFMASYNKNYNDLEEYQYRLKVFRRNMKFVEILNENEQGTAYYGPTRFADLTADEFKQYLGYNKSLRDDQQEPLPQAVIPDVPDLPTSFDWRDHNAVTEVKNQGMCGSCWAFSTTGNIEGQYAIKHGQLLEFSEQELVDCDSLDSGCNGGLMDNAYRYIEKTGGLELESEYPYEAEKEKCIFNRSKVHVQLTGAVNISSNETDMAKWLTQNGPISIAINANAMQFYMGGVSHPFRFLCNPNNLDHGVLIVGYGVHNYPRFRKSLPYWIVKNSWGPSWGEQGYYRVYRGDGTCGVNQTPSSAIVE